MSYSNIDESLWGAMESCVAQVQADGKPKQAAIAVCYSSIAGKKVLLSPYPVPDIPIGDLIPPEGFKGAFITNEDGRVIFIGGPGSGGGSTSQSSVVTFSSEEEAKTYLENNLGDAVKKYPSGSMELSSLRGYTGNDYESINPMLRKGKVGLDAKNIDKILSQPEAVIQEPVTAQRTFSLNFFNNKPVGTVFTDAGFTSTSLNPNYTRYVGWPVAKVIIPPGIRGISTKSVSHRPNELELLLERGLTFSVIQNDENGIVVEVVK